MSLSFKNCSPRHRYDSLLKHIFFLQQHQDTECPAYPVTCEKCNEDGIPRGKVRTHTF